MRNNSGHMQPFRRLGKSFFAAIALLAMVLPRTAAAKLAMKVYRGLCDPSAAVALNVQDFSGRRS